MSPATVSSLADRVDQADQAEEARPVVLRTPGHLVGSKSESVALEECAKEYRPRAPFLHRRRNMFLLH